MTFFNILAAQPAIPKTVDIFLVGGGGSASGQGGNTSASGGGGGGVLFQTDVAIAGGIPYDVVVGYGGAGTMGDLFQGRRGNPGGYSRFLNYYAGGGAAGAYGFGGNAGAAGTQNSGTGNSGGSPGGGGGAANPASGLTGGSGVTSSITGSAIVYGSGGAGYSGTAGDLTSGEYEGGSAVNGFGGGGAPWSFNNGGVGGSGGSGTVIIREPSSRPVATVTGSPIISTVGSYRLYQWTEGPKGSLLFNGHGNFLSTNAYIPASGNFTVECWFYLTSNLTFQNGGGSWHATIFAGYWGSCWLIIGGGTSVPTSITFGNLGGGSSGPSGTAGGLTIAINTWHHIAVSRVGTTFAMWFNGTKMNVSWARTSNNYDNSTFEISRSRENLNYAGYFPGYITEFRLVRGSVLPYNPSGGNISVPTAKLTAIVGTYFLMNADPSSPFLDSSRNNFTITNHGVTASSEHPDLPTLPGTIMF